MSIFDSIADRRNKEIDNLKNIVSKRSAECKIVSGMVVSVLKDLKRSKAGKSDFVPFLDFVHFDEENCKWRLGGVIDTRIEIEAKFNSDNEINAFLVSRLDGWRDVYITETCDKVNKQTLEKTILKVYARK